MNIFIYESAAEKPHAFLSNSGESFGYGIAPGDTIRGEAMQISPNGSISYTEKVSLHFTVIQKTFVLNGKEYQPDLHLRVREIDSAERP